MSTLKEEFEFHSRNQTEMIDADELFHEGKLVPLKQIQKLNKIHTKGDTNNAKQDSNQNARIVKDKGFVNQFLEDIDSPSPRPPTCSVLWKELVRLTRQVPVTFLLTSTSSRVRNKDKGGNEEIVDTMRKHKERNHPTKVWIMPVSIVAASVHQSKNFFLSLLLS